MLLEILFFSANDFFLVPLCLIILYAIIRRKARANKDPQIQKLYFKAFYFKVICVFAYVLVTEFYFGGGDTNLYYQGVKDLRAALQDDINFAGLIINTKSLDDSNPLSPYFLYDNYAFDFTYNYMSNSGNFFIARLGVLPSLVFFNSYLCICLCFGFFALGGAIRLFKTFYHYYPDLRKELAIAALFLPGVGFWSSGLLKDTICFGCVGFILYGLLNILIKRRNFFSSTLLIVICGYLLFTIKTYIFLVLVLGIAVWIFAETNKLIREKTLRQVFTFLTFILAIFTSVFLLQYITSQEELKQYQFENIVSSAEFQRSNYELIDKSLEGQTSYYSVNSTNPVVLVFNSIGATFFRPFIWEVKSAAAVLSAFEALIFLLLTLHLFIKLGVINFFSIIFRDPRTLMCFVFAIIFSVGVGISTSNFGALSRYKIPCIPFYMTMVFLAYRNSALAYPRWVSKFLRYIKI